MNKKDLYLEYLKCTSDPKYPIQTYFETFDKTQDKFVKFNLFDGQKTLIDNYNEHRHNLVLKYRQAGITTVTAAYAAVKTAFSKQGSPERVLIIANKQETAIEFLSKIVTFIKQLPDWINVDFSKSSQKHVKLSNGSELKAVATSPDALRGYTPTILILDEAAFIEGGQTLWSACLAAISTGGKSILISTPNGLDDIYHAAYDGSINNENDFVITHLKWWGDPRFNKDLKMVKTKDIVDWIHKPKEEKIEEVLEVGKQLTFDQITDYISKGYKPFSTWYEKMCRDMNFNKRMINQELETHFIGSGDNVIDGEAIKSQEETNVKDPIKKVLAWGNNLWIWEYPKKGCRYIAAFDPARGDSDDHAAFVIVNFDTYEQVLEYRGKITPDIAAQLIYEYGIMYNAFTTFDITGGMGLVTTTKLKELKYPKSLLHYDNDDGSEVYIPKENEPPGINFASKNRRSLIVSALEEAVVRGGFKVRSIRAISEMKKFVFKNGKPEHMKGAHDDILMAIGMCIYIANNSFKRLQQSNEMTKSMLDSWKVKTNLVGRETNKQIKDTLSTPTLDKVYDQPDSNDMIQMTKQYSWLFGMSKSNRKSTLKIN